MYVRVCVGRGNREVRVGMWFYNTETYGSCHKVSVSFSTALFVRLFKRPRGDMDDLARFTATYCAA